MMSNKCYYAVRAMLELAKREGAGPLTIGAVAAAQDIPVRFLEAILRQLKQAGLAQSHRGKDGGYVLARPARTLAVDEIIGLFDGPRSGTGAASHSAPDANCDAQVISELYQKAECALTAVYEAATLEDLAKEVRAREAQFTVDFSI